MSKSASPTVLVIGGVNGAGKTTAAESILRGELAIENFLNADLIARGLSPFDPTLADVAAGEILLRRMDEFASQRQSFGLESTLSGRSLAKRLSELIKVRFQIHLVYVYVASSDIAVERVATRVRLHGHHVDESVIRRRYGVSLRNFFALYRPLATSWTFIDNTTTGASKCVAKGSHEKVLNVEAPAVWNEVVRQYDEKK